jgi:hypothetical protein
MNNKIGIIGDTKIGISGDTTIGISGDTKIGLSDDTNKWGNNSIGKHDFFSLPN